MTGPLRRVPAETLRVALLAVGLVALGAGLHFAVVAGVPGYPGEPFASGLRLPAWVLVPAFFATQAFPAHFDYRRETHSVSLTAVPLVVAFFACPPAEVAAAATLGTAAACVLVRHQRGLRLAVNTATCWLETTVGVAVVTAIGVGTLDARAWTAAAAGVAAADATSFVVITLVIALHAGQPLRRTSLRPLGVSLVANSLATVLTLVALAGLSRDLRSGWVLVLVVVGGVLALRAYDRLATRHSQLGDVYAFVRGLGPVGSSPAALAPALGRVRDLLHAERLAFALLNDPTEPRTTVVVLDQPEGSDYSVLHRELRDADRAVLASGHGSLTPRPAPLALRSRREDAMTVPVASGGVVVGLLRAEQRSGGSRPFRDDDLQLLETLAAHLGTAVENGRMLTRLQLAATRDTITGLLNTAGLLEELQTLLADPDVGPVEVVVLEISAYDDVVGTLGHEAGDGLLRAVAARLVGAVSGSARTARVGQGRFAVVRTGPAAAAPGDPAVLEGPVEVGAVVADVHLVVGRVRWDGTGAVPDAATLLRRAEVALVSARGAGLRTAEWAPALEGDSGRRLAVLAALRVGLDGAEVGVAYQPQVDAVTGRATAVEALARWTSGTLGQVAAAEFVPLAETSGLIAALTDQVLAHALATQRSWSRAGHDVGVAVNLSARSLGEPDLVSRVSEALRVSGVAPQRLTLEITESQVIADPRRSLEVLHRLRALGLRLSVDDFGTGWSSLAYVRRLPVHEVKIDRTFVRRVETDAADRVVVRSVVDIAHSLQLTVVAEGVETPGQSAVLRDLGVDTLQGWLWAPARDAEATLDWLGANDR